MSEQSTRVHVCLKARYLQILPFRLSFSSGFGFFGLPILLLKNKIKIKKEWEHGRISVFIVNKAATYSVLSTCAKS